MEPELLSAAIPNHFYVKQVASTQSCRDCRAFGNANRNFTKFIDLKKEFEKSNCSFRGFALEAKPKFTCIFAENNRCPTDAKRYKLTG